MEHSLLRSQVITQKDKERCADPCRNHTRFTVLSVVIVTVVIVTIVYVVHWLCCCVARV
jgi:hypothetical protein